MILFVDFEASSLTQDSFPIEVAWVGENGIGEAHLIRPAEAWLRTVRTGTAWSKASEAVHGISLKQLIDEGEPVDAVARRALAVLGAPGGRAVSDQPNYDAAWLRDLLDAAGLGPVPAIGPVDDVLRQCFLPLARLLPPLGDPGRDAAVRELQDRANLVLRECADEEEHAHGTRHRALPDAQSHWRVWRAVKERAERLHAEHRGGRRR